MAGGIRIAPYQPAGVRAEPVPGGGYQQINAGAGDFGQGLGAGLQQLGQQARQASRELAQAQLEQAARDNEAAAYDVERQFRGEVTRLMADPEKGFLAARGRDAADRFKGTFDELEKLRAKYTALARNGDQRQMIEKIVGARYDSTLQTMQDHTRTQRQAWQTATFQSRADDALRDGAAAADDKQFLIALAVGEQAVIQANAHLGDEVVKGQLRKYRGAMFKAALESRLPTDPDGAAAWYAKHRAQFDPLDTDRFDALVKASRENRAALRAADGYSPPAITPTAGGGFNVGNIRNPAGQPGFRAYATQEDAVAAVIQNVRAYPGAFNNGQPMTLQQIGARWAPKGDGNNDPEQWARNVAAASGLPVDKPLDLSDAKTMAAFAKGVHVAEHGRGALYGDDVYARGADRAGGAPAQSRTVTTLAPAEPRRADYMTQVDALAPPSGDPELRRKFIATFDAKFSRDHALWKERMDKALDDAVTWVGANPGLALEAMPTSVWLALDTKQQATLREFHKKGGQAVTDDVEYLRLERMAGENPQEFARYNLVESFGKLSAADRKHFAQLQRGIFKDGPQRSEVQSIDRENAELLQRLGVKTSGQSQSDEDKRREALFYRLMRDELADFERTKGKKADAAERQAIRDRLSIKLKGITGFMRSDPLPFEVRIGDVPKEDRAAIETVLRSRGLPVTDDAIVTMFARQRMREPAK